MNSLSIRARAFRIPIEKPTSISTRVLSAREFVIVTVTRDDGPDIGVGYTYAGTSGGLIVKDFVNDILAGLLAVRDPDDIVGSWESMFQETLLIGRRGAALRAISAVDIALWDLAAKRAGLPLAVMLGGSVRAIPAYASGGYYRPDDGGWDEAVRREITLNRSQGFLDHKIKVGGLSIADDAQRVRAAIDAMEGEGRLALDANNAYRSAADACRAAESFEIAAGDTGLWWFEEPLSVEDLLGLVRVRERITTPVATGEIAQTRHEFRTLMESQAADILQPDAGVVGGITEYMRVVRAAETWGMQVAPHWHANMHVHLASASSNCLTVELFTLEKDIYNFERLLTEDSRLPTFGGIVTVPNRPGLGVTFDETALAAHEVVSAR